MRALPVSPEKAAELARRMAAVGLREEDLRETFVRASGHGGQNVNKVATCVMLRHQPTGLRVKCQSARQQGMNRYLARQWLCEKLEARRRERRAAEQARRARAQRQRRKPGPRAKERRRAEKVHRARIKALRRRVSPE
jgi:protein subunit release factor B